MFGLGVLGMVTGAATMLMTINGLCLCELLNRPAGGWTQRIGSLMVVSSALVPLFWNQAQIWLAVVASVFCGTLLPIAYFTFFLMMNRRSLLGADVPAGGRRVLWNVLMGIACVLAGFGSLWTLWAKVRWIGIVAFFGFVALAIVVQIARKPRAADGGRGRIGQLRALGTWTNRASQLALGDVEAREADPFVVDGEDRLEGFLIRAGTPRSSCASLPYRRPRLRSAPGTSSGPSSWPAGVMFMAPILTFSTMRLRRPSCSHLRTDLDGDHEFGALDVGRAHQDHPSRRRTPSPAPRG